WSTCYQVGSLVANPLISPLLIYLGLRWAFFGPAIWVALIALVLAALLPPPPGRAPATEADRRVAASEIRAARGRVLATPLIWALGLAYFFLKLTRYVLLFWLPYLMEDWLGYSKGYAANVPLAFEAGGAIGSITIGFISERWLGGRRLGIALVC